MSKKLRKIAGIAAPIALSLLAPGIGTALGAGLGLSGTAAGVVGNGLLGAGIGGLSGGGLKGALLGGVTGGAGSALSGSGLLGTAAGTPLSGGLQGPTQGTGLLGGATRAASGLGNAVRGLTGGGSAGATSGLGSLGNISTLGNIASGINSYTTQDDIQKKLLAAQGKAAEQLSPFSQAGASATNQLSSRLSSGFNPDDLTQDPGYQFRLQQGQTALERSLAAQGMGQSGAALKAAQEFGQGLADQTYNDAYSRWLQQNSQLSGLSGTGLGAAGSQADIQGNIGNIRGSAALEQSNVINQTLSNVLRGNPRIIGYDRNGQPIYDR